MTGETEEIETGGIDRSDVDYDLSASRLKTWAQCPEKYRLKYVENKPATKVDSGYGVRGSLVHEAVENAIIEVNGNFDDLSKNRLFKQIRYEYEKLEENLPPSELALVTDRMRSEAMDCIRKIAGVLVSLNPDVKGVEVPIHYEIDDLERNVFGHIDLVTDDEIWDWKTGKVKKETTKRDEIIQGSIYLGGYYRRYGKMPDSIKFVYVNPDARKYYDVDDEDGPCIRKISPSQDNWKKMLAYGRKMVASIESGQFTPDPEEYKCQFCSYEYWCAASPTSPGQINEALQENPELWEVV